MKIEIRNIDSLRADDVVFAEWCEFAQDINVKCGFWCDPRVVAGMSGDDSGVLHVAFVYDADLLVAVIPFRYTDSTIPFVLGLWRLGSVRAKLMKLGDYEFPILDSYKRKALFNEVVSELKTEKICDLVMADNWPEPGATARNIQTTYLIDMPDSLDDYMSMLSSNTRQMLRRRVRKLSKESVGDISVKMFSSENEMELLNKHLETVWKQSWHGKLHRQSPPPVDLLRTLARYGWVRSYLLFIGDVPVASVQGYQYNGTFMDEAPAYDEKWKKYSPGLVLNYYILEDLFKSNCPKIVDFGFGYNQYKETLGTRAEVRGQLWYGMNFKGRFIFVILKGCDAMFKVGKFILGKTKFVKNAKRQAVQSGGA